MRDWHTTGPTDVEIRRIQAGHQGFYDDRETLFHFEHRRIEGRACLIETAQNGNITHGSHFYFRLRAADCPAEIRPRMKLLQEAQVLLEAVKMLPKRFRGTRDFIGMCVPRR